MSRARCYEITPDDGESYLATVDELVKRSGLPRKLVMRRLNQQGIRSESRLFLSPDDAQRLSRQKFLAQTTAHFAELQRERASEEAHEEEVRGGHAEV